MAESRVRAQISALVEPLWEEHKKLRQDRDKVLAELAGINEEIKEVENTGPPPAAPSHDRLAEAGCPGTDGPDPRSRISLAHR